MKFSGTFKIINKIMLIGTISY